MAKTEEGARQIKPESFNGKSAHGIVIQVPADVRVGLALLAQQVYCVDNSSNYFDVPGFEMLTSDELNELLGHLSDYIPEKAPEKGTFAKKKNDATKYQLQSDDNDIQIWIQQIAHPQSGSTPLAGIMGPSGFKAAIYKKKSNLYQFYKNSLDCAISLDNTPEYIVAFAGSDDIGKSWQIWKQLWGTPDDCTLDDWLFTNANQALGLYETYSKQYKIAYQLGNYLSNIKGVSTMAVGHSLGGGLASAYSVGAECRCVTFNAAGLNKKALAQYISYPHKKGKNRLLQINASFITKHNKAYKKIIAQGEKNVQVYSSTTDMLTSLNNNVGFVTFNNNYVNAILSVITIPVNALKAVLNVSPIGMLYQFESLPPETYGNLTYVRTENSFGVNKWWPNNLLVSKKRGYKISKGKDLIFCVEGWIGHGMGMITDGLINAIHDINNLSVSFQAYSHNYNTLLSSLCCDHDKYLVGVSVAKADKVDGSNCKSCNKDKVCLWYKVNSYEGKCVYQLLKQGQSVDNVSSHTETETVYRFPRSGGFSVRPPRGYSSQDDNKIDIEKDEFDSVVGSLTTERRWYHFHDKLIDNTGENVDASNIDTAHIEKRLEKMGKDVPDNYKR